MAPAPYGLTDRIQERLLARNGVMSRASRGASCEKNVVEPLELYGASDCPYTRDMREWLERRRCEFIEYDVDADTIARKRLDTIAGPHGIIPVLVSCGTVIQVGWRDRGCTRNA
jgi:glutaredoxin